MRELRPILGWIAIFVGAAWVAMCALTGVMWVRGWELYRNVSTSLTPGYYLCQPVGQHGTVRVGGVVSVLPPPGVELWWRSTQPHGTPQSRFWLKQVAALADDTVCLEPARVVINGQEVAQRPLLGRIEGDPICQPWEAGKILDPRSTGELLYCDHHAQLTQFGKAFEGCHVLSAEQVFLLGTHPYSFDNRYTGPWTRDRIEHVCWLVWTTKEKIP